MDGFTVDEVARAAGTSRRTFFNHFASKEEAVVEVARVQIGRVLGLVEEADDLGDGTAIVDRAIRDLLDPVTVGVLRDLVALSARSGALVHALQGVQAEAIDRFAQVASGYLEDASAVHAYAFPGAVVTTVGAVYTGRLRVREIDGDGVAENRAPALARSEVVAQLLALLPPVRLAATDPGRRAPTLVSAIRTGP